MEKVQLISLRGRGLYLVVVLYIGGPAPIQILGAVYPAPPFPLPIYMLTDGNTFITVLCPVYNSNKCECYYKRGIFSHTIHVMQSFYYYN